MVSLDRRSIPEGGAMDATRKLYRSRTNRKLAGVVVAWPSTSTLMRR
jgi:hypothetical protein